MERRSQWEPNVFQEQNRIYIIYRKVSSHLVIQVTRKNSFIYNKSKSSDNESKYENIVMAEKLILNIVSILES